MSDTKRAVLDYSEQTIPLSILNENYQPPTPDVEDASLSDLWDAATERQWVGVALGEHQRQDTGGVDEDYSVSFDDLKKYNDSGYSEDEMKFLAGSVSQENFAYRRDQIQADRQAKETLEGAGLKGMAVETAAAIFDPSMLPLVLMGGAAGAGSKASGISKIGFSMLRGAGEGAISEYLLSLGDTQRTEQDILLSTIGGMTFSGLIDGTLMSASKFKGAIDRANVAEDMQRAAAKSYETGAAFEKADSVLARSESDAVARKRTLTEKDIVDKLREEAGERVDVLSKKKVKAIKDEFRSFKKEKLALIERIKSRPKMRPSAIQKEVAQVEQAIANRQAKLDKTIADNVLLVNKNADIDALQQGKIPKSLQARYKELKGEMGEFDTELSPNLGKTVKAGRVPVVDENGATTEAIQSIGAARTRREFDDIETFDNLFTDSDVEQLNDALHSAEQFAMSLPRNNRIGEVVAPLRSVSTAIDSAPDNATRGLGAFLVKNPQRTVEGHQSAEEVAETLFNRAVPDYLDYESAFDTYAKERGVGLLDIGKRNELEQEFEKETVLMQASGNLLSNQPVEGDSAVMLGAKARSRLYEQGLRNNKEYGVIGFDNINHRHEYHSVVFDQTNLISNSNHADFLYDAIASSYMTGGIKLTRENAVRLAKNQVARTMATHSDNKLFTSFMSEDEYKLLADELAGKGIGADIIDDIKQSIFDKEMMGEISPRAMFSLRPNLKARSGDVWLVDLLDTSIARNMKYVSDSAANAGLARNGFKSKHQFQRAVAAAREASIDDLRYAVKNATSAKEKAAAEKALSEVTEGKYSKVLDEAMRLLYREPLEDNDGVKDISRLSRKAVSVVRLRSTGLMSIPEYAVAGIRNGIVNTLKQIPSTRFFDLRTKSIEQDEFMKTFAKTFSATGHQEYLFGRKFYNGASFDDMTKSKLAKIDAMLGKGLDVTMTVNLFKTVQHGGEEMTARAIVSNLRDLAKAGEITGNVRNSLIKVGGLSESQVDTIAKALKDSGDDVFKVVRSLDAQTHDALSTAVRNTIGHSFLRMGIGEMPAYMNKEFGKFMTSLMSFTVGSYEKLLLRGIKNERATLLAITAGQALLGYGALVANTYIQAQGKEGIERDRYIRKNLSDEGAFWGIINRVGIFAIPSTGLQIMNSMSMLPSGLSGVGTFRGAAPYELIGDAATGIGSAARLATGNLNSRESEKAKKAIGNLVPWYNSALYNMTVGAATNN